MITIAPVRRPKPKLLRLGVVHQGQIVEERLVDQRRVTIGPSARDTIVVPTMSLPRRVTLFETRRGARRLCFSPEMDGRVSVGGQVATLDEVRSRGLAQRRRGGLALPLDETARGRLNVGEVTVLFQLVTPPPAQARPRLPASVRGGFLANMDWVLACCLVCFAALNSGFLLYLRTLDPPRRAVDTVPPPFSDYIPRVSPPLPIPATSDIGPSALEKVPPTTTTTTTTAKRPTTSGSPRVHRMCDAACQQRRADERVALARRVAHQILGNNSTGRSAVRDLLRSGAPGTDAERAMDGVGGVTIAGRQQAGRALRVGRCDGPSCRPRVDIEDLSDRVSGPGDVVVGGGVREKVPKAEVRPSPPKVEGIDPEAVATIVRRGMRAVTTCYQRALARNPRLGGKVTMRLSVNTTGAVNHVSFDDDNLGEPRVASCIEGYASRWRFPPPSSAGAEVSVPILFKIAAEQ
jgi:hypothetical protein